MSSQAGASEYIAHHMINFSVPHGPQPGIFNFSYLNVDTLVIATILAVIVSLVLWLLARRFTSGVPGRAQAAVELLYEFVDDSCKSMIHNSSSRKVLAPLGLAVLVWVFFLNAMDLLPVDLLPWWWQKVLGNPHAPLRVVPTADLNTAMALALSVFALAIYYSIKIKGLRGWIHELFAVPFGNKIWFAIPNLVMNLIEYVSKTLSHGMRLWGNMYAGEIVFMVIALLGGAWGKFGSVTADSVLFGVQIVLGSAWAIFHILIIGLQAYLFMILTFVYVGQAHESH